MDDHAPDVERDAWFSRLRDADHELYMKVMTWVEGRHLTGAIDWEKAYRLAGPLPKDIRR